MFAAEAALALESCFVTAAFECCCGKISLARKTGTQCCDRIASFEKHSLNVTQTCVSLYSSVYRLLGGEYCLSGVALNYKPELLWRNRCSSCQKEVMRTSVLDTASHDSHMAVRMEISLQFESGEAIAILLSVRWIDPGSGACLIVLNCWNRKLWFIDTTKVQVFSCMHLCGLYEV